MSKTFTFVCTESTFSQDFHPPIELDVEKDYSLALIGLFAYNSIPNIDIGRNKFYYRTSNMLEDPFGREVIEIPTGSYEIGDIETYLQKQMIDNGNSEEVSDAAKKYYNLNATAPSNLIMKGNSNLLKVEILSPYIIDFTPVDSIGRILGFGTKILNINAMQASDLPIDIISVNSIRVECSLTAGAYYNGIPSYIFLEFSPDVSPGYPIYKEPQNVCYLPINARKGINNIALRLTSQREIYDFMKSSLENGFIVNTKEFHMDFQEPIRSNEMIYIIDADCSFINLKNLLLQAETKQLYSSPYRWVLILSTSNVERVFNLLKKLSILVDSDFTLIRKSEIEATFNIHTIFKYSKNSPFNYEEIGLWNNISGLSTIENMPRIIALRRNNLNKHVITACIVITHNSTYRHMLDKRLKHIDTITKVNFVFMLHLEDMLNATMNYTFESSWGYKDNNSQWNGMIGQLMSKKSDIGGTPLFLTSDRVSIIDYIAMTTPTKSKFVFRQPKLSYITNVFILPFTGSVWISCFGLVTLTALTLYLVIKWEWHQERKNKNHDESNYVMQNSFLEVVVISVGAVCQQGSHNIPQGTPGRIVTMVLYISLMFLYTSYSANIVALLQSTSSSIQTLQDLLKSRIEVGVDDTVFNHFYFPNATEPIRKQIYNQKVAPPGQKPKYYSIDIGVKRMREGLFAFHMETGAGYKIVAETFLEDEKCGLQEIQFLQVSDPWIAIEKNSSFKEMLRISFRKLQESGIQNREYHRMYTRKPQCTSRGNSFVGVGIYDCYSAAEIYIGGLVISVAILLLEILINKKW